MSAHKLPMLCQLKRAKSVKRAVPPRGATPGAPGERVRRDG